MPLVEFYFNPERVGSYTILEAARQLPTFVAESLSVAETDGQLRPEDVEVRVRARDLRDITSYDVEVTVWAKHYSAREAKLDDAAREIARLLSINVLREVKLFVYILLAPAGFAEIEV